MLKKLTPKDREKKVLQYNIRFSQYFEYFLKYFLTRKWKKTENFGTADAYWNNKFQKKNISLFYYVCISIDAEFQGKSIVVQHLWVLFLILSIINQTLFQWRWIESGQIHENRHFYLFEKILIFIYKWAKGHLVILRFKREIINWNLTISLRGEK
jgi:hypothetical protein